MKLFNQGVRAASCWQETKIGILELPVSTSFSKRYIDAERIEYTDYLRKED